ncbi:MAG: glycosyltransferase [Candidatus Microgenomates bacterium]
MAKKPFFSIIIPALNEEKYLPKLLGDLCVQSYQDFEVIVVDGGSRDKTVELANTFSNKLPKLTVLTSPRAHVCTQRNLGAKNAKAEVIVFSDADNRLPPYFLQGIKYQWEKERVDILSPFFQPDISTRANQNIASAINLFFEMTMSIKPKYLLEAMIVLSKKSFVSVSGFDESTDYAEGKKLISKLDNAGYKTKSIREPHYIFSFRRLRKYGALKMATNIAKMELAELLGADFHAQQAKKLYPMLGGSLFNKTRKSKNKFIKNIQTLLKDF